jgi:NAD-dependent SIR2 family protein deacetylase
VKKPKPAQVPQVRLKESPVENLIHCWAKQITQLFNNRRAAVFCGAGISFHSSIPVVSQIVDAILAELGATNEEKCVLLNSPIPFELFMQTLNEHSDISLLSDMFDGGAPNTSHLFLAQLVRLGRISTVCTTNFDTLLERALARVRYVSGT